MGLNPEDPVKGAFSKTTPDLHTHCMMLWTVAKCKMSVSRLSVLALFMPCPESHRELPNTITAT